MTPNNRECIPELKIDEFNRINTSIYPPLLNLYRNFLSQPTDNRDAKTYTQGGCGGGRCGLCREFVTIPLPALQPGDTAIN